MNEKDNSRLTVLVCDDDKDISSAISIFLRSEGYNVLTAGNGREAVDTVEKNEVHLVLLDIMMPVMDGVTALAAIREISNVPVIMLTAKSEDTDKILGLNMGADDISPNPLIRWNSWQESDPDCADICSLAEIPPRKQAKMK